MPIARLKPLPPGRDAGHLSTRGSAADDPTRRDAPRGRFDIAVVDLGKDPGRRWVIEHAVPESPTVGLMHPIRGPGYDRPRRDLGGGVLCGLKRRPIPGRRPMTIQQPSAARARLDRLDAIGAHLATPWRRDRVARRRLGRRRARPARRALRPRLLRRRRRRCEAALHRQHRLARARVITSPTASSTIPTAGRRCSPTGSSSSTPCSRSTSSTTSRSPARASCGHATMRRHDLPERGRRAAEAVSRHGGVPSRRGADQPVRRPAPRAARRAADGDQVHPVVSRSTECSRCSG